MSYTPLVEKSFQLDHHDITALQSRLTGELFSPGDPGYDQACLAWNLKIKHHPILIVAAKNAPDIVEAVKFAGQHQLGVAVQATGHGNVRPANDCLLILTREMSGVEIDPVRQTARIEAGTKWGKVLVAAQEYGLAPLLGSSPTVGAVGYTLGGGLGWLGRKYGLSTDSVIQFEVVTADGSLRTVSSTENSELFWGLRGGGGSLAVITAMTVRLYPVSQVYAGNLYYPAALAGEVFRRYRDWIAAAPDELTSSVVIMNFPPIPQVPDFLRGKSFAIVRGCYCGSLSQGEALLRYWRDWQAPQIDDFKPISFRDAALISNDPSDPSPGFNTGAWLRELSDAVIDTILGYAMSTGQPSPVVFAEVRHAGGAISRIDSSTAAFGNRDAELILSIVGMAPTEDALQQLVAYTDAFKAALRPGLTGGVYMNFIEGVESQQRLRDGLAPGGYERLAQLKTRFDPENMFRFGFNVMPTTADQPTG